jgi:hypothetical protein
MLLSALAHEQVTLWWITLGLGAVVLVVVVVLLSLLTSLVKDIEINVDDCLETAGLIAENTQNITALDTTLVATTALGEEVDKHAAFLTSAVAAQ